MATHRRGKQKTGRSASDAEKENGKAEGPDKPAKTDRYAQATGISEGMKKGVRIPRKRKPSGRKSTSRERPVRESTQRKAGGRESKSRSTGGPEDRR